MLQSLSLSIYIYIFIRFNTFHLSCNTCERILAIDKCDIFFAENMSPVLHLWVASWFNIVVQITTWKYYISDNSADQVISWKLVPYYWPGAPHWSQGKSSNFKSAISEHMLLIQFFEPAPMALFRNTFDDKSILVQATNHLMHYY